MHLNWTTHGDGPPLLLLHGFTGVGRDWLEIFGDGDTGFRLLMPDLPGHGGSPMFETFSFRDAAAKVLSDLDEMGLGRRGSAPIPAMGMSGGGQVLLHLAVRAPDRIGRTVLVSTAPSFPAPARALMRQAGPEAQDAAAWAEMRRKHPGGDDQVRALFQAACELDRSDVDLSPSELGRIRRECLIVHGDADPFYPMALVAEMRRAIPRGWLWALPWEGHCPIFGEKAARFREASLAFLTAPATLRRGA